MWCLGAVLIIAELITATTDMTQICSGLREGDAVPNPIDCQSYYVCGGSEPTLQHCDYSLHFDTEHKVCNWPERAKCTVVEVSQVTTVESTSQTTPIAGNSSESSDAPINSNWISAKSQPMFVAVNISTGLKTDPMTNYDPEHIECRHLGAYFLPHPRNCRKYYICAYGHLLQHACGHGTLWNYKRSQCELGFQVECYNSTLSAEEDVDDQQAGDPDTPKVSTTAAAGYTTTVCFFLEITASGAAKWSPAVDLSLTPPTIGWPVSGSTERPTASSTPRVDDVRPECPSKGQAYLPHPKDCRKYYICIVGMPIMTSCPQGLYWDQKGEFCDLAQNVRCFQN